MSTSFVASLALVSIAAGIGLSLGDLSSSGPSEVRAETTATAVIMKATRVPRNTLAVRVAMSDTPQIRHQRGFAP